MSTLRRRLDRGTQYPVGTELSVTGSGGATWTVTIPPADAPNRESVDAMIRSALAVTVVDDTP